MRVCRDYFSRVGARSVRRLLTSAFREGRFQREESESHPDQTLPMILRVARHSVGAAAKRQIR
jgi:hypothetical protein